MQDLAKNSLVILSILVLLGGILGYAKAKSRASLVAGIISSSLLAAAFMLTQTQASLGILFGLVVTICLIIVFAIRLKKTRKFMPGGLMLSLCLLETSILISQILGNR